MNPATSLSDARLSTGVPGLDELFGGGLLPGRTVLIKGAPGSGKTTLGLQILVAGATQFNEPGALISFEQQPDQLFDDAARFGWDLVSLREEKKFHPIFIGPEQVLQNEGRQAHQLLVDLADLAEDFGMRRVLIDSLSHLEPLIQTDQARAGLLRFLIALKKLGITPLLTSELHKTDGLTSLEAYLVDTVVLMTQESGAAAGSTTRWISVMKGRGLNHMSGRHPLEIGPGGVRIFPHSYHSEMRGAEEKAPVPLASGVEGLDAMLGGGYSAGSIIFVAGLSGTFKTSLAARFLAGGEEGERGLWISFLEDRAALARRFCTHGLAPTLVGEGGCVEVIEAIPGNDRVEKLFTQAREVILAQGIRRVVVDGINELANGAPGDPEREESVRWFLRSMRGLGVTTLLTQQLSRVTGRNPMTSIAWVELADTILYLGIVEIESRLERVISVAKHRGGPALGDLRGIAANARGLVISDRFVGLSGVLDGTPLGKRKTQIEEIFQPLYFIRDFLTLARTPGIPDAKRDEMLQNLSGEAQRLIDMLSRYFDEPQKKSGDASGGAAKS